MATNFPSSLDDLSNPQSTESLSGHAELHSNVNDALEAMQSKIGINNSEDTDSLDYKVTTLNASVDSINESLSNLGNSTDSIVELLGLEGNNDLIVTGIENKTAVDSFSVNAWRTVYYNLQIARGLEFYSTRITLLFDGSNINISESDIVSNTNNSLADITFEENSGIISLCVTPITTEVTARYIRTAIKQ